MTRLQTFFGMLMVLGALATGTIAQGQASSEFIQVSATGVFVVDGEPVTCNIIAFRNTTTNASGQVTRNILSGNITLFGRLVNQDIALNTGITTVRYENQWAILNFPYESNGTVRTAELHLKARSAGSLGLIQGAVQTGKGPHDLFNPRRSRLPQEIGTHSFSTSGVTITYRRF